MNVINKTRTADGTIYFIGQRFILHKNTLTDCKTKHFITISDEEKERLIINLEKI